MTAPADTDPQAPPGDRMRCSDAQRLDVVHRLQDAVGQGLLTLEECTERTDAAYRARYVDELPPLTADLPEPQPVAPGWRTVAATAGLQARMSLLGTSSWAAADARRRRMVLIAGLVAALLLVMAFIAAATAGGDPGVFVEHHHHWNR